MEINNDEKEMYKDYIVNYLQDKGLRLKGKFSCLNPEHHDAHPSMSYFKKGKCVKCFACNVNYDIYELVKLEYKLNDFSESFLKVKELYGDSSISNKQSIEKSVDSSYESSNKNHTSYYEKMNKFLGNTDYYKERGLSVDTLNKFNIGFDAQYHTYDKGKNYWRALIIPTSNTSFVARNTDPNASSENRYRKVGNNSFLNIDILEHTDEPIFIVEGEIDALSIIECGAQAISLGSTSNINSFINLIKNKNVCNKFILALDNDNAGKKASIELKNELEKLSIETINFDFPDDYKDINQMLVENRELLKSKIEDLIEEYSNDESDEEGNYPQNSATITVNALVKKLKDGHKDKGISTGFKNLDASLDGGIYEGLYIIGAISAIGKTSFILQLTDNFAHNSQDVLYFSLEMSSTELISKSLSRLSFIQEDLKEGYTTRDILSGKVEEKDLSDVDSVFNKSVNKYLVYSNKIVIHEGIGDIGLKNIVKITNDYITKYYRKPVIIIDYLQIIAPYNERYSDKQNMDKAVLELKRLSRDLEIPVICISSFNRQSYNTDPSMQSFKESGAIEYSADVLIGLSSKTGKENETKNTLIKKNLEVEILKNRNGKTGKSNFEYYPAYNYFKETF